MYFVRVGFYMRGRGFGVRFLSIILFFGVGIWGGRVYISGEDRSEGDFFGGG